MVNRRPKIYKDANWFALAGRRSTAASREQFQQISTLANLIKHTYEGLSDRSKEIVDFIKQATPEAEIAETLGISIDELRKQQIATLNSMRNMLPRAGGLPLPVDKITDSILLQAIRHLD